jgi:hypothetical protein
VERIRRVGELTFSDELHRIDIAVREWARQDPKVAERLRRVDNVRMDFLRTMFGSFVADPDEVEARCTPAFALAIGRHFIAAALPVSAGSVSVRLTGPTTAGCFVPGPAVRSRGPAATAASHGARASGTTPASKGASPRPLADVADRPPRPRRRRTHTRSGGPGGGKHGGNDPATATTTAAGSATWGLSFERNPRSQGRPQQDSNLRHPL